MLPEEKAVIRENLPKLISDTGDLSNLKAQVVSRDLLSPSEVQTIFNSTPDTESQLYRFYDTIPRKGADAFEKLVESLTETNNTHIGNHLRSSLDRKRSSLTQTSISSGSDDVFENSPRPKRCRLDSLRSQDQIDESDDDDSTGTYAQDFRYENGKINSKKLLKLLFQSRYSTSIILKEVSISGRIAEKVYLPKLQTYSWQNSKLEEDEEIDTGILLFFYKNGNYNSLQFSDICCTGVSIEIDFAGEFVIVSDEKLNFVKVGGARLLDEIGIGGLRKIFSSIKSNNRFPKRIELFDVYITRCPFPIDTAFLIQELCMKDVSFSKAEILQKTIEICPDLDKLELISTAECRKSIELDILQTGTRKKMSLTLTNFDVQLSNCIGPLSIKNLELHSCNIPEDLFVQGTLFNELKTISIKNCTSPKVENLLNSKTFLNSLVGLTSLQSIWLYDITNYTIDLLKNNNGLQVPYTSQGLIILSKNASGQFIV